MGIGNRRRGKLLPSPVTPADTICIQIAVPNAVEYIAAFFGQLDILGSWYTWDHPTDGTECADCEEAAQLWRTAIYEAQRSAECGAMSCDDVADCIETNEGVQEAIVDMLDDSEEFQESLSDYIQAHPDGITYPKDQPIPSDTRITVTQPGECDYDKLWAQCVGVVSTAHAMIGQFFFAWGAFADEGDIVRGIVANTPLLGPVAYSLGIVGVQDFASLIVSSIAALYAAAADDDYREQLACDLFCAGKDACYVTIDTASSILNARIGGLISLISTTDIMVSLIELDLTGMNVADVYMAAFFDLLHQGNLVWPTQWGMDTFLASVAAYNVPDDGWESACEDCPPVGFWEVLAEEGSGFPNDVYGTITSQTSSAIEVDAVLYIGIYRIKLHGLSAATLSSVSYSAVTYYTDPGGLGYPVPANGNTQQDIFMASTSPFSLSFSWTA